MVSAMVSVPPVFRASVILWVSISVIGAPLTIREKAPDIFMAMGDTAEVVATRYNLSREYQDEFSLESQRRTAAAQQAGLFDDEIVPMHVKWQKVINKETKETEIVDGVCDRDECNRPETTLEGLAKLGPVFREGGTVTAGNSSQLSDGSIRIYQALQSSGQKSGFGSKSR